MLKLRILLRDDWVIKGILLGYVIELLIRRMIFGNELLFLFRQGLGGELLS